MKKLKTKAISKDKVQEMISRGLLKTDITIRDILKIEEFLKVGVGFDYDLEEESIGWAKEIAAFIVEDEFRFKGKKYCIIHITLEGKLLLVGRKSSLLVKWKSLLGNEYGCVEIDGTTYDTRTAKFIHRRISVNDKEVIEEIDAGIFDLYRTPCGKYFQHFIGVMADWYVEGGEGMVEKYEGLISVIEDEELIETFGSVKLGRRYFEELEKESDVPFDQAI